MTNQQAPEIYALHTVPNKGERPWSGIYAVRADAEHDAKVLRDATGRDWSVVRLVVADTATTPTGPVARYKIGYHTDDWGMRSSSPSGIPDPAGAWVRYEDHIAALVEAQQPTTHVPNPAEIEHIAGDVSKNAPESNMAQQPATSAACPVDNNKFDHQTAADVLNGKTVSDEAIRKFVAFARWAHYDRVGLRATLLSVRGELASREAEIALLKKALMDAEAPQPSPTAQAAESVPAGPKRKDMLWSTAKMQERHDQRIENIVSGLERIKQEHAGQKPQKIDECYGDCPTDPTNCTNPCRFDGRAARAPADSVTAPAAYSGNIEHELAMLTRRIVSSARRNCQDGSNVLKLANEAWAYLVRKGLEGSPLRDAGIESDITPPAQAADSVQEDAARWQWLTDYLIGERTDLDEGIVACTTVDALRQFADAARKQGANHD